MLVRPFVPHLTMAEIHQVMTSGFATISGSVLVAYISLGLNSQALVSSCIMSIPASLAVSKLRYPETEETLTAGRVVVPDDDEHRSANALHAFANGAWLGLKIAGMIVATLLCIIALLGLINGLLTWWGHYININDPPLTLQLVLGYICYPVAFLLGVPRQDLLNVGQLIGVKIIANEFVAFTDLTSLPQYINMSSRSRLIATYALCECLVIQFLLSIMLTSCFRWLWQLRELGHSNWCSLSDRPGTEWRCESSGSQRALQRRYQHVELCEHCGNVGH